ncbi:hypothetical protein Tco_0543032, partial [Tanacetum coccineum]
SCLLHHPLSPIPLCTPTLNQGVFWGADEEIPDGGVPRVIVYGYDGLPMQPVDPPSPDYVPGPEHPSSTDYVPGPEHPPSPIEIPYIPEPEYPEYLVPSEDEEPMEDQPLPDDASPAALSPGYVPDSDPEVDLEEDSEDHADYPADGGDGVDEVLTPTPRPTQIRIPLCPRHVSVGPPDDCHKRPEATDAASMEARMRRAPLGYRAARIRMRATVASPPSLLPSTSHRTDVPEAEMPPRKRACFATPALGCEIGESSAAGAARQPGPTPEADTWDEFVEAMMEIAPTTLEGVDQRVTELDTTVR